MYVHNRQRKCGEQWWTSLPEPSGSRGSEEKVNLLSPSVRSSSPGRSAFSPLYSFISLRSANIFCLESGCALIATPLFLIGGLLSLVLSESGFGLTNSHTSRDIHLPLLLYRDTE